ncbi:MAG: NAD-binding protein [Anaerolineae bacterium]|nr:NAD-binding protein [Anaerolineae bacterium]
MDSLQETLRQLRTAIALIVVIVLVGVFGFMLLEQIPLLDAIWMTVITLTTIGYGDMVPHTVAGRLFNLFLIVIGLGSFAFALQAAAELLLSPTIRNLQIERLIRRKIARLDQHFIITGSGPLIAEIVRLIVGVSQTHWRVRVPLRLRLFGRRPRYPNPFVVITPDFAQATALREQAMLALVGTPADDAILRDAGVERTHAMMITLDSDAENILTVLTARQYNSQMLITSSALTEEIRPRIIRVGANRVILPYEIGGQFLNMATLRPVVSDFFRYILFNLEDELLTDQFRIPPNAPSIGQRLPDLPLLAHNAGVLAIRRADGAFDVAPPSDHVLAAGEIVIAVCPIQYVQAVNAALTGFTVKEKWVPASERFAFRLEHPHVPLAEDVVPTPDVIQQHIDGMSNHYVIWADGQVGRQAIENLDPARPFVIITRDAVYADQLRRVGFRILHCATPDPEAILLAAGVERALSLMVSQADDAESALTVLTARALNPALNITAEASNTQMEAKLKRAGADRVSLPLRVAAEFILLSTMRPIVTDFFQHVVFNRETGIETTELVVRHDSPFIDQPLHATDLATAYDAHVIGIRSADGRFTYAPAPDRVLRARDVLIVVLPMRHSDDLRARWHGTASGRLSTTTLEMPVVDE